MSGDVSQEALSEAAEEAKVLLHAAETLSKLLSEQGSMMDRGELPEDETSQELESDLEAAAETCRRVSLAMTMGLAQYGYVPDFDDEGDDDGDDSIAFA